MQAAVYRDLAPGERELSHERVARHLLASDAPAEQIAAHVLATPRQGERWVIDVLRAASRSAFSKGAPDAAIASLRRALAEPMPAELRTELLFELGRALALMSLPDSAEALRGAYEGARDPLTRGHAADWLACTLIFLEAPDDAAEIAGRTRLELAPDFADLGRQLEASELISIFFGARDDDGARQHRLQGHRTIDTNGGPGAKMLAAVAAWEWAETAGPADSVVALARAALGDDTLVAADAGYLAVAAILPLALADLDEASDGWEAVRAEAHRSGFVFTMLATQLWGGYTQYLRGDLAEAESELRAALGTAELWGVPAQRPSATAILAELLVDRGAVADARVILDGALRPRAGSDPAMLLDRAQMRVLLAEGRAQEALAHADEFQSSAGWRCHPRYAPWRSLKAQALDRLGRQDEAVELVAEELEIARGWGSPGTVGRSLRVLGAIERDAGLDHLEEACALLENAPARLERAKALAALGVALRHARRPTDAREPLRKALELAEISGATALVERTRAEIYATGARPRSTALHGVRSLTASERRVADLAGDGLSNRDIAQTLYVTPKTVEVHLSNVYRKLEIGSRRELAHALALPAEPAPDGMRGQRLSTVLMIGRAYRVESQPTGLAETLSMATSERPRDRGRRRGEHLLNELLRELREARLAHDLSQASVGAAVGLSDSQYGLIERGGHQNVSLVTMAELLSVVGLELSARAYPVGRGLRDAGQLALLARLREQCSRTFAWRTEVPMPIEGDLRAWDASLVAPTADWHRRRDPAPRRSGRRSQDHVEAPRFRFRARRAARRGYSLQPPGAPRGRARPRRQLPRFHSSCTGGPRRGSGSGRK